MSALVLHHQQPAASTDRQAAAPAALTDDIHGHICGRRIDCVSPLQGYVSGAAMLGSARPACEQMTVMRGAAVLLDKKHFNVYIPQLFAVSLFHIQGFMIYV